jgi:hypothetical protein
VKSASSAPGWETGRQASDADVCALRRTGSWFVFSPVRLARVDGVRPTEVRRIETAVLENEALFLEKWHEHNRG